MMAPISGCELVSSRQNSNMGNEKKKKKVQCASRCISSPLCGNVTRQDWVCRLLIIIMFSRPISTSFTSFSLKNIQIHAVFIKLGFLSWQSLFRSCHSQLRLFNYISRVRHSPEDDQSLLIETSSCTPSSFSELITTQLRSTWCHRN